MEQYDNLREYFLKFFPCQAEFEGKTGEGTSERYIHIKNVLNNKKMSAIVYSVIFRKGLFAFLFQTQKTKLNNYINNFQQFRSGSYNFLQVNNFEN